MSFAQRLDEVLKWKKESNAYICGVFDEESNRALHDLTQQHRDYITEPQDDGYHVTMRFWFLSKTPDPNGVPEEIKTYVERLHDRPIPVLTGDFDVFGKEKSLVLRLESDELLKLQAQMDRWLQQRGVPPSDFPSYKAHVTIGRGAETTPLKPKTTKLLLTGFRLRGTDLS